jgi:[ribosomal protein S18]-alanine N-acetyltransferase
VLAFAESVHSEDAMSSDARTDIVIERVKGESDLDLVASLEARCFTNPWSREMLARQLAESETTRIFVLRLPEVAVAAFCSCWFLVDELHVNTLVVDFPFRRQGLGRLLMHRVLIDAARSGVQRATLEVRESNRAARGLYEGLGFAVTAKRPNYYSQPEEDALILWHENLAKLGYRPY